MSVREWLLGANKGNGHTPSPEEWLAQLEATAASGHIAEVVRSLAEAPPDADSIAGFLAPARHRFEATVLAAMGLEAPAAALPQVEMISEETHPTFDAVRQAAAATQAPIIYMHYPIQQPQWRDLALEVEGLAALCESSNICAVFISGYNFFARREFLLSPRLEVGPATPARFLSDEFIHHAQERRYFVFAGAVPTMHGYEVYRYRLLGEGGE